MKLSAHNPDAYRGMSYEAASREAERVCKVAGTTGQTMLAAEHLAALHEIMRRVPPASA